MLPGPPAIYQTILDHPDLDQYDLSTLRLAVTGAAAVPGRDDPPDARASSTFETIVTGYGLTETTGIATMCRHDDDPETIATTAGRAIPDVEVQVVDDNGSRVAPGRARRGRGAGLQRHARRTSTTPTRRPTPSMPTAGCTPATSACSTRRATSASPTARRTCSSSVGSTPTRPRSRTC